MYLAQNTRMYCAYNQGYTKKEQFRRINTSNYTFALNLEKT